MAIQTISLRAADSDGIAREAKERLRGFTPGLLLFFASSLYDATHPSHALQTAFPDCTVLGATSHSEYCGASFSEGTVSIMAIDADSISDFCVKLIPGIRARPDFSKAVADMHAYFGGYDAILEDFDHYVGIVLFESGSKAEEYCMDKLGTATDILFVGGSSSSEEGGVSRVYLNGGAYEDVAILAVLKTVSGYDIVKTQSAGAFSDRRLTVTKSDMENRLLCELDHRPAGEVYAELLAIPREEIEDYFISNPFGVISDGEIFIRTIQGINDSGLSLYCGIPEGTELHVLKIGRIIEDTKRDLNRVITYKPAGVINFNCLYRTIEIQRNNLMEPYCALFGQYPSIGFSTFGEAFLGHINETSTVLVIK